MKTMIAAAVLALLMTGCAPATVVDQSKLVDAPADAERATALIVADYGLLHVPPIYWYGGDALTCADHSGFLDANGECVRGVGGWDDNGNRLIILSDVGGLPMHFTSMSHELGHDASMERGHGDDNDHDGEFFRDPGEDLSKPYDQFNTHGLAGAENRALEALGM